MKISSQDKIATVVAISTVILLLILFIISLLGPDKLLLVKIVHNVDLQGLLLFVGAVLGIQAKTSNRGHIELAFLSGLTVSVTSLFIKALPDESLASVCVTILSIFLSIIFYGALVLLVASSCQALLTRPGQSHSSE
ncbi:hypothetical protein [Chromohalobacter nigrandesensis]|uniref:hypothetical protein n=1 Tax=Chromohalobacter nigrandesensis TaxID=119863 RepID=UPI001FF6B585|nr:hypothetical protein [Chromohalobacter nigrandesensis]MCK0744123.1 hypothetical protein [Chromohalobacter nigrandesensis]